MNAMSRSVAAAKCIQIYYNLNDICNLHVAEAKKWDRPQQMLTRNLCPTTIKKRATAGHAKVWQVWSVAGGTIAKGNDDWQLAEMVASLGGKQQLYQSQTN